MWGLFSGTIKSGALSFAYRIKRMDNKKWLSLLYHPGQLLQILIVTLCNVAVAGAATIYFSWFTDLLVGPGLTAGVAWKALAGYILLQCVMELVNYLYQIGFAHVRSNVCISIRDTLMESLFKDLNPQSYQEITKDRITSVILNDIKTLRTTYLTTQMTAIRVVIRLVTFCGIIFYFNVWLGFWMILVVLILFAVANRCNRAMEAYGLAQANEKERYLKVYQDCLDGRADYKYAGKDSLLQDKTEAANEKLENVVFRCGRMRTGITSLHTLSRFLTIATFLGLEFVLAAYGHLTVGSILASLSVFALVEDEINLAQNVLQKLSETKLVRDRVYQILETWREASQGSTELSSSGTPTDSADLPGKAVSPEITELLGSDIPTESGNLTVNTTDRDNWSSFGIRNVTFGYQKGKPVLREACVSFQRGKKYLIVGESGCGKSTILKLMLGVFRPEEGGVFLDGTALPAGSARLLDLSAYMDQNFYLFQDTVADNIFFGREDYRKNLEASGYCDILKCYVPDLSKEVSKNGSNLSGGQRQVIGIARLLASGKQVLMLDESLSALDEKIFAELLGFLKKKDDLTLILVSHRSQVPQDYDAIYEVFKGKVYEKQIA
jgi:ABC-type bacteriocin/lantibiotic exporter with double-glycine peptidase domain